MSLEGMDVQAVSQLAGRLQAQAGAVNTVIGVVDGVVSGLAETWRGEDMESFVNSWRGVYRASAVAAAAELTGCVTQLTQQMGEQTAASGGGVTGVTGLAGGALAASAIAGALGKDLAGRNKLTLKEIEEAAMGLGLVGPGGKPLTSSELEKLLMATGGSVDTSGNLNPEGLEAGLVGLGLASGKLSEVLGDLVKNGALSKEVDGSIEAVVRASVGGEGKVGSWDAEAEAEVRADGSADVKVSLKQVEAEASIGVLAEAAASASGHIGDAYAGGSGDVSAAVLAETNADGKLMINGDGADLTGNAGAMAGAEATEHAEVHLGGVTESENASAIAGIGADAQGKVEVTPDEIEIGWKVGAALGIGGQFGGSVSIDPEAAVKDAGKDLSTAEDGMKDVGHVLGDL